MTGRELWVDTGGNAHVGVEITGLLPRTQIDVFMRARFAIEWACGDGKRGGELSMTAHPGRTEGSHDTYTAMGSTLSGRASQPDVILSPTLPSGCSADYPIPIATGGRWEATITDLQNGLVLTPEPYEWRTTY